MKVVGASVLIMGALLLGAWLHVLIAELTGARGTKLAIGRAAIWGALMATVSLWLARHPVARFLLRWAKQLESRRKLPVVRQSAAGTLEVALAGLFLAFCAGFAALVFLQPHFFPALFWEDGPFETASAILYALAALGCIRLALQSKGSGSLRVWLALLATLFIVVGGEEISWGQRIFEFATPESLESMNVQGEFTLHNLYSNSLFVYPGLAVTAILLFVLPLLNRYSPIARQILRGIGMPVAPFACAVLYGVALVTYGLVGLRLGTPTPLPINWSDHHPHFDDEMLEFLISLLFAIYALTNWRIVVVPRATVEMRHDTPMQRA